MLAYIFDTKMRGARSAAKLRLKESKKLLRRAKEGVSAEVRKEISEVSETVAAALDDGKIAKINKSTDRLGLLLNKHLDAYRKPAWRESFESIGVAVIRSVKRVMPASSKRRAARWMRSWGVGRSKSSRRIRSLPDWTPMMAKHRPARWSAATRRRVPRLGCT